MLSQPLLGIRDRCAGYMTMLSSLVLDGDTADRWRPISGQAGVTIQRFLSHWVSQPIGAPGLYLSRTGK